MLKNWLKKLGGRKTGLLELIILQNNKIISFDHRLLYKIHNFLGIVRALPAKWNRQKMT